MIYLKPINIFDVFHLIAVTGVAVLIMKIEVLGPGCPNCKKLEQEVFNALAELNIDAEVAKVTDLNKISSYGVLMTPGLVINRKVYSSGKLPVMATLKRWMEEESKR